MNLLTRLRGLRGVRVTADPELPEAARAVAIGVPELARQGVRTRFIGRRDRAPVELREQMARLEDGTAHNERLNLWIAFDYGGRAELVEAARRLVEAGVEPAEIDENLLR